MSTYRKTRLEAEVAGSLGPIRLLATTVSDSPSSPVRTVLWTVEAPGEPESISEGMISIMTFHDGASTGQAFASAKEDARLEFARRIINDQWSSGRAGGIIQVVAGADDSLPPVRSAYNIDPEEDVR